MSDEQILIDYIYRNPAPFDQKVEDIAFNTCPRAVHDAAEQLTGEYFGLLPSEVKDLLLDLEQDFINEEMS